MRDRDPDASELKNRGWRQGSVLKNDFATLLINEGLLPAASAFQKFVIVSHDCDVANRSFEAEPEVELLCARVSEPSEKDGKYFWAKNPRRYQFERSIPHTSIWNFVVHRRFRIPRDRLLDSEPDSALALSKDETAGLALWLARRYLRAAFPDAFVERTRQAARRLRKRLKAHGNLLKAVFLLVDDEELPAAIPYNILLYGAMGVDDWSEPEARASAQFLLDKIEAAFGESQGVEVRESALCSEAEISLDDLRRLKRWDFDDLTMRGEGSDGLPPEG